MADAFLAPDLALDAESMLNQEEVRARKVAVKDLTWLVTLWIDGGSWILAGARIRRSRLCD